MKWKEHSRLLALMTKAVPNNCKYKMKGGDDKFGRERDSEESG